MTEDKPSYEALELRLAEAESMLRAIQGEQIDAMVGNKGVYLLRLKEMEASLRESENRVREALEKTARIAAELRAAFESTSEAIIFYDTDRRITYMNPMAQKLLGFGPRDVAHLPPEEVFDLCAIEKVSEPGAPPGFRLNGSVLLGETVAGELVRARPRGHDRDLYLLVQTAPITLENGEIIGAVQTGADITSLYQARQDALEANRAKSAFLANMSHELRTPMNGVLGMTDLALMKTTNPQVKEYLGYVKESGLHLLDIINDILDLSRIESGKIKLNREEFSLKSFLDVSLEPLLSAFASKNLSFDLNIDHAVPNRLIGDAGRLRQVLANLLGNALKFTERGGVSLYVSLNGGGDAQDELEFLFGVHDTGIGIPATHLEKVFDSFEQVHSGYQTKYEGTGLGLSISKNLVELMGGKIWVESREGVGSTFFFTVVLEPAPTEKPVESAAPMHLKCTGRPLNILVAEDDMVNQVFIRVLLEDAGHSVTIVETGRQALEKLPDGNFDLVLMDIRMPDMNGDEATRIIRRNRLPGVDPKIPIIALTAYALETERQRFMDSGFDDYLTKPVEIEKLNRLLAELDR
jgi:PAS domain S-box-containing protein